MSRSLRRKELKLRRFAYKNPEAYERYMENRSDIKRYNALMESSKEFNESLTNLIKQVTADMLVFGTSKFNL